MATEMSVARQGHLPAPGAVTRVTPTVVSAKLARPWPALVDLMPPARACSAMGLLPPAKADFALPVLPVLALAAWAVYPFSVLSPPGCLPLLQPVGSSPSGGVRLCRPRWPVCR